MIETVKYLCEFFFCNFWHFCGLVIVVAFASRKTIIKNYPQNRNQNEQRKTQENC